jgi:hypothetical protein
MRKILKGAVVLLIAIVMVFSTVAIADTQTKETTPEINTVDSGSATGARGDIVWDNGMNYDGLLAAQEPSSPENLDAYPADDFHFEEDTEVCDVHWIGGYWNGDPQEWDWCILFYYDRGDGEAPGNVYAGKYCYSWDEIGKEELEPSRWEMWVDLPENIWFPACYKFWISIWAVGDHFPQSGWGYHEDPIIMHEAVLKSDWFGVPDWTDTSQLLGYPVDMCFQLTTKGPCEPSIDVEKYVWDEKNGEWVDADTQTEALNVPKCSKLSYKIVIHNDGTEPLYDIIVRDKMHDSLKFISSDPEGEVYYEPPYWYIEWYFQGPLMPCDIIEIYITAHVEGEVCSYDENYVLVEAYGCGQTVRDDDYAWIHIKTDSKFFNSPLLNFLQSHPNMFPLLQIVLQRLGLF